MNVSITQVVRDLGTSISSMQSAIAFYTLTMAALMLIGAKLNARWGLLRAFTIGSIIYGLGSSLTAFSVNMPMLFLGWSVIEGIGAVLVIPAIAALIALNYKGKERAIAYAVIGAVSGAAAAAGPLIGGFMTTYLSWRYVFLAETIVMAIVIYAARHLHSTAPRRSISVELTSAVLSATGMVIVVFAMLQSKSWGWVRPIEIPTILGYEIAPLGISLVAYLLVAGALLLRWFYRRQLAIEAANGEPLLRVSMLTVKSLRSGLSVLLSQYLITAAVFFVIPIYLQTVLGLNALDTGLRIFPLSIALIIFSAIGSRLSRQYSPRQIVRLGQYMLIAGSLFLLAAIDVQLQAFNFGLAMFVIGGGLGLLAAQLSNINISSAPEKQANEVGGLQGTAQNLGSALGTALIGSILIGSLTGGVISSVNDSTLPASIKSQINMNLKSAEIIPASEVVTLATSQGALPSDAQELSDIYLDSQLEGLKQSIFFLFIISMASLLLSSNIPREHPTRKIKRSKTNTTAYSGIAVENKPDTSPG